MKSIIWRSVVLMAAAAGLAGCASADGAPGSHMAFPTDSQIAHALQAQFASDPDGAAARELVRKLGGEQGRLRYQVHHVIYRQGAYEARYDAVLVMGQPGAQSLLGLYASMIPEPERAKLPQATLPAYEGWLRNQAETLKKTAAPQAQALVQTVELLGKCYRDQPTGAEITLMLGLGALLSPERGGQLFAEKLAMPGTTVQCLPA